MATERLDLYRKWTSDITYKPDWTLRVVGSDPKLAEDGPALHLVANVADSCATDGRIIEVVHRRAIPEDEIFDQDSFNAFVFETIISAEQHETAEWFRINGERVHNPHDVSTYSPSQTVSGTE